MDETLKRRLVGTGLLLAAAFILVSVLPDPQLGVQGADEFQRVTIELAAPEAVTPEAAAPAPASVPDRAAGTDAMAASVPAQVTQAPASAPAASAEGAAPDLDGGQPAPRPESAPVGEGARPEPQPPPPAATAAPVAAPGDGARWWVQVGSFSAIENARQAEAQLRRMGEKSLIAPIETARGTLYRVRSGPYSSESLAKAAQAQAVRSGYTDAQVVRP